METQGSLILNMMNNFLTFSYKKKNITLQNFTMNSCSQIPSFEDLKYVSNVILLNNHKSLQKMQDLLDKVVANKDEEISRLRNHIQSLIAQIEKLKNEKKSQQEKLKQLKRRQ
jgi:hypothetical protein